MQEEAIINKKNAPCITNPTPQEKAKYLLNERFFNGFMLGFFLGGIIGIIIHDLVIKGIL